MKQKTLYDLFYAEEEEEEEEKWHKVPVKSEADIKYEKLRKHIEKHGLEEIVEIIEYEDNGEIVYDIDYIGD